MDRFDYVAVVFLLILALVGAAVSAWAEVGTKASATITVASKEDSAVKSGHKLLIQDKNNNWYEVKDSFFNGVFLSRDTWGKMSIGKTYKVTYYGWRFGPFSWYPNIIEATETK